MESKEDFLLRVTAEYMHKGLDLNDAKIAAEKDWFGGVNRIEKKEDKWENIITAVIVGVVVFVLLRGLILDTGLYGYIIRFFIWVSSPDAKSDNVFLDMEAFGSAVNAASNIIPIFIFVCSVASGYLFYKHALLKKFITKSNF
ncbi:hypothetical protein D4T62_10535 [Salmonella enterica subsp. enterica]|nr:hypothetical protein [Salmonella enterica subsp. enterica]EDR3673575.1 hypothetical protein [Salmonella enterica subsp. arizonae serovar 40:z4,z24:]